MRAFLKTPSFLNHTGHLSLIQTKLNGLPATRRGIDYHLIIPIRKHLFHDSTLMISNCSCSRKDRPETFSPPFVSHPKIVPFVTPPCYLSQKSAISPKYFFSCRMLHNIAYEFKQKFHMKQLLSINLKNKQNEKALDFNHSHRTVYYWTSR